MTEPDISHKRRRIYTAREVADHNYDAVRPRPRPARRGDLLGSSTAAPGARRYRRAAG